VHEVWAFSRHRALHSLNASLSDYVTGKLSIIRHRLCECEYSASEGGTLERDLQKQPFGAKTASGKNAVALFC
jgi:hypothetical protein